MASFRFYFIVFISFVCVIFIQLIEGRQGRAETTFGLLRCHAPGTTTEWPESATPDVAMSQRTTSEVDPGATTALSWGMPTSGNSQTRQAEQQLSESDLESTREFDRLQDGPFHSRSEQRPTAGRPRADPRCGSTRGRPGSKATEFLLGIRAPRLAVGKREVHFAGCCLWAYKAASSSVL